MNISYWCLSDPDKIVYTSTNTNEKNGKLSYLHNIGKYAYKIIFFISHKCQDIEENIECVETQFENCIHDTEQYIVTHAENMIIQEVEHIIMTEAQNVILQTKYNIISNIRNFWHDVYTLKNKTMMYIQTIPLTHLFFFCNILNFAFTWYQFSKNTQYCTKM